jgi:hypothetical protein
MRGILSGVYLPIKFGIGNSRRVPRFRINRDHLANRTKGASVLGRLSWLCWRRSLCSGTIAFGGILKMALGKQSPNHECSLFRGRTGPYGFL